MNAPSPDQARWTTIFDALEERVRRLEALTRGETVPPPPPLPGHPADALPADLAPRALALLDRTRAAERQAEDVLRKRRAEYAAVRR